MSLILKITIKIRLAPDWLSVGRIPSSSVGLTGFAIAKNKVWSRHGRGGLPIGLILSTLIFSCGFLQLFRANISIWHKAGMCPALRRRDWSMRFPSVPQRRKKSRRAAAGRAKLVAEIGAQLGTMGHLRNCCTSGIATVSPGIAAVSQL